MGPFRYRRHGIRGTRDGARGARRDGGRRARDPRLPLLALTILAFVACGGDGGEKRVAKARIVPVREELSFTAIESPSLQFLPRGQEAPGWRLEEDPIVVPGDRLVEYLGADGNHFRRYEALDATIGNYAGNGNNFATLEIFRFPDFVKSFGAYSTRKTPAAQFLTIANESFAAKHSVHLWRGPFYIRITGGGSEGAAGLVRLASFVAERMPAAPGKPAVFNFFPNDARVPNSERFSAERAFGQAFLANSFQASFNVNGEMMEGLVIPAANKAAATKILDTYRALYVRNGKLLDPIANLGEDNFTAEDKYLGRTVAFRLDRFVIAFNGFNDRQRLVELAAATHQRILGSIRKQLVAVDKEAARAESGKPNPNVPPWMRR